MLCVSSSDEENEEDMRAAPSEPSVSPETDATDPDSTHTAITPMAPIELPTGQPQTSTGASPDAAFKQLVEEASPGCMWKCFQDTFAGHGNLINEDSILHPNNLYEFQIAALRRIQKKFNGTLTTEEEKQSATTPEEIAAITRNCERKRKTRDEEGYDYEVAEICKTIVRTPIDARVRMPCGSGKTAVGIWAALLFARNTLIVTDTYENASQTLDAILKLSNLANYFDVKYVRADTSHVEEKLRKSDTEHTNMEVTCSSVETDGSVENFYTRHILNNGGTYAIVIMDANLFKDRDGSSSNSIQLRRTVFQSTFDLLIVDEADTTMAAGVRRALQYGVKACGRDQRPQMYKVGYRYGLFMSATWSRGVSDLVGTRYLLDIPQVVSLTVADIEKMGLIATSYVNIVVCNESEESIRQSITEIKDNFKCRDLSDLTPAHMRCIEMIVNMHAIFGHKIIIYVTAIWQLRMMQRLFPDALTACGEQTSCERQNTLDTMKPKSKYKSAFILLATNVCATGLDIPELDVVINAVNFGESNRILTQRFGRASRRTHGKTRCYVYDVLAKGQHHWVEKIIDPKSPTKWTDQLRYALIFGGCYSNIKLWTDDELITNMQQCMLAAVDKDKWRTTDIHTPALCYRDARVKHMHVLSFLCSQQGDPRFGTSEKKSGNVNAPDEDQRKKAKKQSEATAKRLTASLKGKNRASSARKPTSGPSLPAVVKTAGWDGDDAPDAFTNGVYQRAREMLKSPRDADPNAVWKTMRAMEEEVAVMAKAGEAQRSRNRAHLLFNSEKIRDMCPFPNPPQQ
jgi:superfamily II DNA or RNA helicase